MTTVSIARCADYDRATVGRAWDALLEPLGGLASHVRRGDTVLLKPNLVTHADVESATTTHPSLVGEALCRVRDLGARPVVGDSPAFGAAEAVAESAGIGAVARHFNAPIVDFRDRVVSVPADGASVKRFRMSADVLEADVVLNLPKLKAHRQMLLTAGVKNLYGCVPGKKKAVYHLTHGDDRSLFAGMILEYVREIRPTLTVVDGIIAMARTGPRFGDPYPLGLLVASVDPVAVDRVLCDVLAIPADDLPFIPAARKLGVGETDIANIVVEGVSVEDARVADFALPTLIPATFSPLRLVRSVVKDLWSRRTAASL
ncbi:thylakoid-associated protein [Candidatus Poribacteria bacterium]|nr:thylakoid-associated protein [Candidatus Poribacteria bacterium]